MSLNYDAIDALTRKKYIPKLVDEFFKSTPLLVKLREKSQGYNGGPKIVQPLIYGELAHGKSYTFYDTLQYDQNVPISAAEFEPKNLVQPFIISRDEERRNSGSDTQVISLIESKMEIAKKSLTKMFATQLYGDGTGNSGKDLTGLKIAVSDAGVYGGINRSTYTWWRSRVDHNNGTPRELTLDLMLKMLINISEGADRPNLIVCSPKCWAVYHNLLVEEVTLTSEPAKEMANYGFQTLEFMGIPVVADPYAPDNTNNASMYFLNLTYLSLRHDSGTNFTSTPFRQADDMLARKKEILWSGNLTCSNCQRQGVIKDIDTSEWA